MFEVEKQAQNLGMKVLALLLVLLPFGVTASEEWEQRGQTIVGE